MSMNKKGLDKKGKLIFLISMITAAIFFISGILVLTLSGPGNNVGNTGSGNNVGNRLFELELNKRTTFSVEEYEIAEFEYTPSKSGYYTLTVSGGGLRYVLNPNEVTISFSQISVNEYGDTNRYEVYLLSGTTYTFNVYATSSFITLKLEN